LLCLGKAKRGGESTLASSAAIYNEILAKKPEFIELLCRPLYETTNMRFDDTSGNPVNTTSASAIPVFSWHNGRFACVFRRRRMMQGMERRDMPLSDKEIEAMMFVESLADSDEYRLDMDLHPGDIQFLNNYATLHSRKQFEDAPDEGFKRRMLRIWINLHAPMEVDPHVAAHMRRGWPLPAERRIELALGAQS